MDCEKLIAFYVVAINKSISKASAKLDISQSAISRQIQYLEFDLKTLLFIRHQKGVILTEQGENLYNDRRLEVFRDFLYSEAKTGFFNL